MKTQLSILLCLLLSPASALAQLAPNPNAPPPNPQVAPLPAYIAFNKVFTYPPPKPLPPTATPQEKQNYADFQELNVRTQRLDVVKTEDIRQDILHYTDGTVQQSYKKGDVTFTTTAANPNYIMVSAPWMESGTQKTPRNAGDFSELDWITAATFKGKSVLNGQKIFQYQSGDQQAEIDATTRLPLHAHTPDLDVVYTYLPQPTEKIVLPEAYVKKLGSVQHAYAGGPVPH